MLDAFVDPPSPFAPLEEWEEFRKDMMTVEPRTPEIAALIRDAEEAVERLRKERAESQWR